MFLADQKIDGRTFAKRAKPSIVGVNWLKMPISQEYP